MFYSHLLLARKAPLGQIWMAATMHAKMNRKKLNKLNIIKICEEILNPSIPMALRLSGILMGGVVIVYQRKVKLLYDDVNRLLVEINEAWKVKESDPTLHPKNKARAKYEDVTLKEKQEKDLGSIEHLVLRSDKPKVVDFQQTSYIAMNLDDAENPYNDVNQQEGLGQDFHQVDAENITLFESYQEDTRLNSLYERFGIEGDDETQINFTTHDSTQIPDTLIPSPREHNRSEQHTDDNLGQHPEDLVNQKFDEGKEDIQKPKDIIRKVPAQRKARKPATFAMDNDQILIPSHIYQTWLRDSSDIVSRRGRKRKNMDVFSTMKLARLMDLPPLVLIDGLFTKGSREVHYPMPLLNLWTKSTQSPNSSGRASTIQPPQTSSSSPSERNIFPDPSAYHFEDFNSGVAPDSMASAEKQRENFNQIPQDINMEQLGNNVANMLNDVGGVSKPNVNDPLATPGGSGNDIKSIPSSGSGHGFPSSGSSQSFRSNRKRPHSLSRHSSGSLEPVQEDFIDMNFKISRLSELSETGLTPDNELLMETETTQTQKPSATQPYDKITDSIRMQLKTHFDTPGSSKVECLNDLTFGMDRKQAALLFYQTCVLTTQDFIKVEQEKPYGDILISRGSKM